VLGHRFLLTWDDWGYVVGNPAAHGLSLANLRLAFGRFFMGNYAPVHLVSHMLDHELFGLDPRGYAAVNVLLHAASAALLYLLAARLGLGRPRAALAALVFALHPAQVESVAWISQRKSVLSMLFLLASFHLWLRWRRTWERGAWAASLASFALALLSKPVAVVLPPALFVLDRCLPEADPARRRGAWRSLRDLAPFAALALACAAAAVVSQEPVGALGRTPYLGGSLRSTLATMPTLLARYLGLLLAPLELSPVYEPPIRAGLDAAVAACAGLALALAALGVWLRRRARPALFWYALFFLGLAPVSQLVPLVTLMNDRYLHVPLLGAAPFLAWALVPERVLEASPARRALAAAFGLWILALPVLTVARVAVWRDDVSLWTDATRHAPRSTLAWFQLGGALDRAGRRGEGALALLRVLALDPDHDLARASLGKRLAAVRAELEARAGPPSADDLLLLGAARALSGDALSAASACERSLALRPGREGWSCLGRIQLEAGALARARESFARAAAAGPDDARVEYDRARVEALAGDERAALAFLERALRLGYKDGQMVRGDPDLARIRRSAWFRVLEARYFGAAPR
jgi:hypothetical protein